MIIAHRGVHDNITIPENSLLAFKKAIELNYAIEFDIEITNDDKLIIHHDDNLTRMTGVDALASSMNFNDIRKLKLLNTNEIIPTFREVLDLVDGRVFLDIEIKTTKKINKIVKLVLDELKDYKGELTLKSFNPFIVKKLKKETNKYKIGLLVTNNDHKFLVKTGLIYLFKYDFLDVNKKMLNDKYYLKHIKKTPMRAWTFKGLNDASKYQKKYPELICICNDLKK